jgi:hypothetical protein
VNYPALPDQASFTHNDLSVNYSDPSGTFRTIHFDNQGPNIQYPVGMTGNGTTITSISEPGPSWPPLRTSCIKGNTDTKTIRYEIAPPANLNGFLIYAEGIVK